MEMYCCKTGLVSSSILILPCPQVRSIYTWKFCLDSKPKFMECVHSESNILHSFNQKLDWNYCFPFCYHIYQIWTQFLTDQLGI